LSGTPGTQSDLGEDLCTLQNLCRDDAEALAEWEKVTQRQHGGDRKSDEIKIDNVQLDPAPTGNSRAAALPRLRKDREDLHKKVLAGEMTCSAAMIEAGFRKKLSPLEQAIQIIPKLNDKEKASLLSLLWNECPKTNLETLRSTWEKCTPKEQAAFLKEIHAENRP
jgi:hypothetical protein